MSHRKKQAHQREKNRKKERKKQTVINQENEQTSKTYNNK